MVKLMVKLCGLEVDPGMAYVGYRPGGWGESYPAPTDPTDALRVGAPVIACVTGYESYESRSYSSGYESRSHSAGYGTDMLRVAAPSCFHRKCFKPCFAKVNSPRPLMFQ